MTGLLQWVAANKQWLFDGVGVTAIGIVGGAVTWVGRRRRRPRMDLATIQLARATQPTNPPPPRVYVDRKPQEIVAEIKGMTDMQAAPLMNAMYIGKWLTVDLPVKNVTKEFGSLVASLIAHEDDRTWTLVHVSFKPHWGPRLSHVRIGERLRVTGRISGVRAMSVELEDGEVIEDQPTVARG